MKKSSSLLGSALLLLTAMIWGFAFSAQKQAGSVLAPFSITSLRSLIAAFAVFFVIMLLDRLAGGRRRLLSLKDGKLHLDITPTEWKGGILCGLALGIASYLQQFGMDLNGSAGKTAFITALYVALVPVLGIFIKRPTAPTVWLGVLGAMVGAYFLAIPAGEGFSLSQGDLLVLACALVFAGHILIIDRFSPRCDGVRMSFVQFLTVGVLMLPISLILERPTLDSVFTGILPLLYLGLMSSGAAYTLQIVAQGKTHPAVASVLLSLESVFGVVGGAIVFGERMSEREYLGCGIMLASVLITELGGIFRPHAKEERSTQ